MHNPNDLLTANLWLALDLQLEAAAANLHQQHAIEAVANNFYTRGNRNLQFYFLMLNAGTLKRTYCGTGLGGVSNVRYSNYGVYADGARGEYIKLLESTVPDVVM